MARLFMAGAELIDPVAEGIATSSTVEYTTEEARTGQYSYKITSSGTSSSIIQISIPSTEGKAVYVRGYFKFTSFSPNDMPIMYMLQGSGFYPESLVINSSGVLGWRRSTFTPDFSATGPTISLNTWHRIEYSVFYDNSLGGSQWIIRRGIRVDGIPYENVATTSDNVTLPSWSTIPILIGWVTTEGTITPKIMYVDDIAVNDSGGSEQNSWPGEGSIGILLSESDELRGTGWTGINGTETTNLYTFYWPKLGTEPTSVRLHHNFGSATSYLARFNSLASIGVTDNSQIKVVQRALAAGKVSGPNTVRTGSFGMTDHPTWPTVNVNPPNLLTASTTPNNWQFHNVIDTNPSYWSAANWDINQPSRFTFRRTNTTSNHLVFRYAVVLVEFKKPIEVETELSSTSSLISTIQRQRSADEVLSAASNYVLTNARERRYNISLSSETNTLFEFVKELYDSIDFKSLTSLSQTSIRERTISTEFLGNSSLTLAVLFATLAEISLEAASSFSATSILEAMFSGTWLSTSEMDADVVAERMNAFGLTSESSFNSLFLRERSDSLHTSAISDTLLLTSVERSGQINIDAESLIDLLPLLERHANIALDADTDFDAISGLLKSLQLGLTGSTEFTNDYLRERWLELDATVSSEFSGLPQAVYSTGLSMIGNSIFFLTSEAGGLILAEITLDSNGLFTVQSVRNLTNIVGLSSASDFIIPNVERERSTSLSYEGESIQSLVSSIEARGNMTLDAQTILNIVRERERSLSTAFNAQSSILLPFERIRTSTVPYNASGSLLLSLDFTVTGQLFYQATGTLLSEAVRDRNVTLPFASTSDFSAQIARELSNNLALEAIGYLVLTHHTVEYIPSIEYYFRHRGNRFFRNIPIREMLVPVLREPWFNEFHIEQQLQTKDLLPFFIKIDRDDR